MGTQELYFIYLFCLQGWLHSERHPRDRQLLPRDVFVPQRSRVRRRRHWPAGPLERHLQLHRQSQVRLTRKVVILWFWGAPCRFIAARFTSVRQSCLNNASITKGGFFWFLQPHFHRLSCCITEMWNGANSLVAMQLSNLIKTGFLYRSSWGEVIPRGRFMLFFLS